MKSKQPVVLPMSKKEMDSLGWDSLDILLVSGDAYVDHPSFGTALLGRWLVSKGFKTGIIAQPEWKERTQAVADVSAMGRPRLFAGVNAGAIDSMLAHYTAFRKKRSDDAYTPGGQAGARPNRAVITYTGFLRQAYPNLPVVIGGIEASLRRISHYDFWEDKLRRSILLDAKADILMYGMGELALLGIARAAKELFASEGKVERQSLVDNCRSLDGIVYAVSAKQYKGESLLESQHILHSQQDIAYEKRQKKEDSGNTKSPNDFTQSLTNLAENTLAHVKRATDESTVFHIKSERFSAESDTQACEKQNAVSTTSPLRAMTSTQSTTAKSETFCRKSETPHNQDAVAYVSKETRIPSHEDMQQDPKLLMQATKLLEQQVHNGNQRIIQQSGDRLLIVNPPAPLVEEATMDAIYDLPFSRLPHPSYSLPIPAWEMIRTSITTHRGCGGGCSFCSLALHQGRRIASRSEQSLLKEAAIIAQGPESGKSAPRWSGSISDVGGPSANMWQAHCTRAGEPCLRESCMHPKPCRHFVIDQMAGVKLLRKISSTQGIRHVRVASGVRFDLALQDREAMFGYTSEFTGGQLKVAPEHTSSDVLHLMRKPSVDVFESFLTMFFSDSAHAGKEQYTIPYLMSAFPGCTAQHMKDLKAWLDKHHWKPQQVQCFIPTPGTVATAMFYAGIDMKGNTLYVARSDKERMEQHHLLLGDAREHRVGKPKHGFDKKKPFVKEEKKSFKGESSGQGKRRGSVNHENTSSQHKRKHKKR